ncbi:hypothetical protein N0V90_009991 [Kalmusia sp. IMI 367209]|nr:hypothetical protein N0V90_009991 [Kalmusia sp. IMI 367209]
MYAASYIIAASQLFALAFGAPLLSSSPKQARSLVERAAYKVFGGDGTPAQGWPQDSEWVAFEDAWSANVATTLASCSQFSQENNSQEESDNIKKAIQEVSTETNIKAEFLLAIVMQESKGCVRAPTTNYGFDNPGLMQSFQGTHSCNPDGNGINPCPYDMIKGMIQDGAGVGREAGLTQSLAGAKAEDVSKYYKASRIYNSGSVDPSGNLGAGIATHCYASDVANRLIGWTDNEAHGCEEGSIGGVTGGAPNSAPAGPSDGGETQTPPDTTTPPPTTGGGEAQPTGEKFSGAAANCSKWYTVKSGDGCASTGVDMATLTSLNTGLSADCSNLWLGSSYCIAA